MNVLFLSLSFSTDDHKSFYEDLLMEFQKHGDKVFVVCAKEKKAPEKSGLCIREDGLTVLRVPTGNITGSIPLIEKGLATMSIDYIFKRAIKNHFDNVLFDLIIYPTPPITLVNTITAVKKRTRAKTYLLLKDIFPQNAVDLGMMKKTGIKSIIYKYFRKKEKQLYRISDMIGCMSPANVEYVLTHNPFVKKEQIEVCPNCIMKPESDPLKKQSDDSSIREKYSIPPKAVTFIYGGNLGKPQGIPFLMKCLDAEKNNDKVFFFIVGKGSEYSELRHFIDTYGGKNAVLLDYLPKDEYQRLVSCCQVGLIFLDYRFTIPNFPSRLLSNLIDAQPVIVATDRATDIGDIAETNGFGFKCYSNDVDGFVLAVEKMLKADRESMGRKAWDFFLKNYTSEIGWAIINDHFKN